MVFCRSGGAFLAAAEFLDKFATVSGRGCGELIIPPGEYPRGFGL